MPFTSSIPETDYFQDLAFLQSIIDSIEEGVIIHNRKGRVISFNKKATGILGLTTDQLFGKALYDTDWQAIHTDGSFIPGDEHPVIQTLRTGKPKNNITLGIQVDQASIKWLSVNTRLVKISEEVFVFATLSDITKLVTSNQSLQYEQEKLRASEEKFSKSFHFSAIGMAIVSPDGSLQDVNEAFCKMIGYSKSALLQKTFQNITYPDDLEKDLALVHQMLSKEIETYQFEKRYIHKKGHLVWAMLTVSLVWNVNNEPHFFVSQIQEITELKKLNKNLEEQNLELLKTEGALKRKIVQLKDFAGIITHDVRGPAHNIKKMVEMYETSQDETFKKTAFHHLKKISDDLTNNLNELVHILQIHLEKDIPYTDCDINGITESVCLQLQDSVTQKNAQVIKDFRVPIIHYPKIYMQSIIYNLVSNSLKYSHKNVEPLIRISTFSKEGQNFLSVADNGLGIDMHKFGKSLFKFQKSFHSGYDSKGIGLYLIRNQVEDLGGTITAESDVAKGSVFTVRF